MKLKQSRAGSFIVIAIIYVLASVVGIYVYGRLHYSFWINILIADLVATAFVFLFSVIFNNASVYDPYWSVQPIVIILSSSAGVELTFLRLLSIISVCLWGVRLTANWAYTFQGLNKQDWRYSMLKEKTGKMYPLVNFIGIHTMPTLIVYGCIIPAVFVFRYETQTDVKSIIFFLLSVSAIVLQTVSDFQMHRFRKTTNDGFIRSGLWKYSRHPNYLGEILMWWGVALLAVSVMPERWYLTFGAAANTFMFLLISIPLADKHQARKEGFDEYRMKTRMLLPIKTEQE